MNDLRLLVLGSDAAFAAAIRDVLAAQIPDAASDMLDPAHLRSRPIADGVVIDGRGDAARGAELASRVRAMGFAGALVVASDGGGDTDAALAAAGAAHAASNELASQLVSRLAEQLVQAGSEHAAQVMRARRLVAAGEIALRFQHALNNPLAGILAETQLMQLEPLPAQQQEALERIVGLCRRIIELGTSLDGLGELK
ncbi:MAG: histidine kinase dimerization/phospho-acceptor domain-containing protein [Gemmatimonadales bacterium]